MDGEEQEDEKAEAGMSTFDAAAYGASGIAEEYDALYADEWDTDLAVRRLASLADGGAVLEFGIGTGRLALPLATHGIQVDGIDGSPEMIAKLRGKPGGGEIDVWIGDFGATRTGRCYRLVVLAVNTIFALPDQEAQLRCFQNAALHLEPGGAFVVEAWLPDLGAFRDRKHLRTRVVREDTLSIEGAVIDPATQTMRTVQAVLRNGSIRLYPANHRYAWPAELDLMAQLAGFHREARWDDWSGADFDANSRSHVTVYRMPR